MLTAFRVFLGYRGCCQYQVTCLRFAQLQFKRQSFGKACCATVMRVMSCHPLTDLFVKQPPLDDRDLN